jgi:glycosyltransferase involved in cell wall biosynthesis
MRVGFTLRGSMRSAGGYYYLLNLLCVLRKFESEKLTPILLVGEDEAQERLAPFQNLPGLEIRRSRALNRSRQASAAARALVLGCDTQVRALLREAALDVLFEAATFYGWRPGCRVLAWFPDFQHRALPHLFSPVGWWRRELGFRLQVTANRHVIVSSHDALAHALRHYLPPQHVSVVRFALPPPSAHDVDRISQTVAKYGLPSRYFFMPNQFWLHKNHLLVIEALARLAKQGEVPTVLASGQQVDPRHHGYFERVREAVNRHGLEPYFLMPGLLPKEDMAPLLLGATALLNPSLYEGWSTPVEEAKSAGVPMILSDLDVHREQAEGQAVFFARHDPGALADALRSFTDQDPEVRQRRRELAGTQAELRIAQFAHAFVTATQKAFPPTAMRR